MLVWFVLTGLSVAFIGVDIRRHARTFVLGWLAGAMVAAFYNWGGGRSLKS